MREQVGNVRVSVQLMAAYVPHGTDRTAVAEAAQRRFGYSSPFVGTGAELIDYFGRFARYGVERIYVWFCDFASPETLAGFGSEVIAKMG
jgi:hypothetical protein